MTSYKDSVRGKLSTKNGNKVTPVETTMNTVKLERDYVATEIQGIEQAYFTHSWGTELPDYPEIVGAKFIRTHNDKGVFIGTLPLTYDFDPSKEISLEQCTRWDLCLPTEVIIPQGLLDYLDNLIPANSVTYKTLEEIKAIADEVDHIPEAKSLAKFFEDEYIRLTELLRQKYTPEYKTKVKEQVTLDIPEKTPEYDDLDAYLKAPFPKLHIEEQESNKELECLLEQLKDLKLEDLQPPVVEVNNEDLTDRSVNGTGSFDYIASALLNQLDMSRKTLGFTNSEIAPIYAQALVQAISVASQFSLEKANVLNQSYALKIQATEASINLLKAKAEMLMLPAQMKLAYAQLEAQLKQIELLKVQIELEKEKFPQMVAQTDLILAQTDGQRRQNELSTIQVQQSEMQSEIIQEQHKQSLIQTENMTLNNNKMIQDTKLVEAQVQNGLKDIELKDTQKLLQKAQIKVMAQQAENAKEQLALAKAQTLSALAQLSLIKDQRKVQQAQISDTINGKPIGGLLGAQILVNKVQASSFERKSFNELVNQVQSGWAANKTADIAISSPAAFTPIMVDRMLTWGMSKYYNMPNDLMSMPEGYTPYLSDDEMDGLDPVSYNVNTHRK